MSFVLIEQPETEADLAAVTAAAKSLTRAPLANPALSRIVVVTLGDRCGDLFFSAVVARLMIAERLDVEVGYASPVATPATRRYRLKTGPAGRKVAETGTAQSLTLIRDDAATVLVGRARHLGADGDLYGEGIVDDERIFDGEVGAVEIEVSPDLRDVRGRVARRLPGGWRRGRAVQTGGTAIIVEREGISATRTVKRSTFYKHHEPWKLARG
ncbi:hypothetical protein GOEFS_076_00060 [Gordonia effusa NBRC 100432]|uniref:Uncharacterized protein n=1 Tax=Gordonia effusa NBRC 100432 TaxID=1077974 RepID=H0R276_9ACTN|nr:hypothetical protein [Gordonia effusa]GAB19177.1 hypothetical protein GOEFS_076_00060 [Gordonia effusa NBRC 100432]